jgi:hypothetical protein
MDEDDKSPLSGLQKELEGIGDRFGKALYTNINPTQIKKIFDEVETSAFNVAKAFGVGRTNILNIKAAMTDAVGDAKELGYDFEKIAEIQQGIAEGLGRNVILNTESYKQLLATSKVTGVDAIASANAFKAVGVSYMGVQGQMQKVMDVARSMGVNAQAVSKDVVANLGALNKYNFKNGIEGLAKMVSQAKAIGADFSKILQTADKLFQPDAAIEMAAAMQRLGVTQSELLDPLRLMDMAQNDPGELMNQMGKMSEKFVQLNKDGRFEIMPGARRQLMEIAGAAGMSYEEIARMAVGSKELDMKLSKIKFPATFDDEQKNFIANLAEIGPGGEMTLTVDGTQMGIDKAMETFASDKDALNRFMEDQKPKDMETLAKEQLTVAETGNILLASIKDRIGYGLASSVGMDRFGRGQIELNKNLMDVVKGKTTEGGVEKAAVFSEKGIREGLGKQADELFKSLAKGDFGKAGEAGSDIVNEGYKMIKQIGLNAEQVYKTSEFGNIMRGDEKKTTAGQTATVSTEKTEIMSYLDKLQKQVQTPTTQNLNYSGNLNVTFSAPPGVNTTEVERVLNELMKKPEFIQMIAQMAKDPTGKQNPSQQNMNFGR